MKYIYILLFSFFLFNKVFAEEIKFSDSWGNDGFSIKAQSTGSIKVIFSIKSFSLLNTQINGKGMQELSLPGVLLPNDEGAPNLPGTGRYIALPNGAEAVVSILNYRIETYSNIEIAPAPRIPWDTENGPLDYEKNAIIYSTNAFYPENPVTLSEKTQIRGIESIMLGITPFKYNPVTKELIVYRDIEIEISLSGGNGQIGDNRLRSRWWDPLMHDIFLNASIIPDIDYKHTYFDSKDFGCEYLIVSPNNQEFQNWADTIKKFRTLQGINTDVITLDEIGGNTTYAIENFINEAYDTWDIVPAAILLLGDYGTNAANSIVSPIWDSYCVSDNIYADVTNNDMPDIIFARITAQDEGQLETMITKFINYETNPPTNPGFYDHPVTALGWQTERWFQICSETIGGFWKNELGKDPVRINEVYGGNPITDPWSTATNTYTVLNMFGPNGLNYIPSSPNDLGDWNGGDPTMINDAINDGAFALQHRDHGYEQGWGEPSYSSNNINGLNNTDLTFIFSVNCLTGKYNLSGQCFTEKFHRYTSNGQNSGALGLIAASEVSYSFVNDTYVWGMYDNLWPDFLPTYGSSVEQRGLLPAFGNAAGKYFLQQSSWPYNTGNKEVTYNLFHHHGDAFLTLYSEVPQNQIVLHADVILEGSEIFSIFAEEDAFVALTINNEIIGTAEGNGESIEIAIPIVSVGSQLILTVTKQNYYRYQSVIEVIESNIPYVVESSFEINDGTFGGNGLMDYGESLALSVTLENIGNVQASGVTAVISTENEFINFTNDTQEVGNLLPGSEITIEDAFSFDVDYLIPDLSNVIFDITISDGTNAWISQIVIQAHAPILSYVDFELDDSGGNNNGKLDPGETVDITVQIVNEGSSEAYDIVGELNALDPNITINTNSLTYGNLIPGDNNNQTFSITVSAATPEGLTAEFEITATGEGNVEGTGSFSSVVGRFLALVLDLDLNNYSGPKIFETFNDMDLYTAYTTDFPEDLGLYKNLFVCLGLHFSNYELSQSEGQLLKDFLLDGGNIWMEGRVTWKDDTPTPVHPMFKIETEDKGMYLMNEIMGVQGSFTQDLFYSYDGNNPYNDYEIIPVSPANTVFTLQDPFYGCGVANNAGAYKTIGTTFEFGKLLDDLPPNTKAELMQRVLGWFDGNFTGIENNEFYKINSQEYLQSAPNPFNSNTSLKIIIEKDSPVSLNIYNIHGELVCAIINNEYYKQGTYEFIWEGNKSEGDQVPNGIYFGVLQSQNKTHTIKLILSN